MSSSLSFPVVKFVASA